MTNETWKETNDVAARCCGIEPSKHTPTPWKISKHIEPGTAWTIEADGGGGFICNGWGPGSSIDDDNAAFIVRAVNSHEELLGACQMLVAMYSDVAPHGQSPVVEQARAAIAKAKA
jgi:hypothetical protein